MAMIACVTTNIEAAHKNWQGQIHGHSYLAELWFEAGPDLPTIETCWKSIASLVDHTQLEISVGDQAMEAMAEWLMSRAKIIGTAGLRPVKIVIRRPTLGYTVECQA